MNHLRLAHSPDPDDAFMWWPLVGLDGEGPQVDTGSWSFELVAEDIETLNQRAEASEYDITAISCAQYPRVSDAYAFTACGASLGDGYGPKLVSPKHDDLETLLSQKPVILVPGERTSALAAMRLMCPDDSFTWKAVEFESIAPRLLAGEADAGVLIHEGQLTWQDDGLHLVADLGAWWEQETGLPLPLGGNVILRSIEDRFGAGSLAAISAILRSSVDWALEHREESLGYALHFARGLDIERADRFVELYVNHWTLDFGARGQEAVARFLGEAASRAILPKPGSIDFIAPGVLEEKS
ncbi:MAG: ABC transporter substrate-binding protein [Phycisphaerae bacterium]|nr:ABC transporter substrate-binding protein [Phycisphaerae bacterium]